MNNHFPHHRGHRMFTGLVTSIIVFAFIATFVWWIFLGYTAYQVVKDPKGTANEIGQVFREFEKGYNK